MNKFHFLPKIFLFLFLFGNCLFHTLKASNDIKGTKDDLFIWYDKPAEGWGEHYTDALPLGNGFIGAMVFGGITEERIALNESSFWGGCPHDYNDPDAYNFFPQIRDLVFAGKVQEAEEIAFNHFWSIPVREQPYQPVGDLLLSFPGLGKIENYHRELNLNDGIAKISFSANNVKYTREIFVSYPDRVLVMHISADKPGSISVNAKLHSHFLEQTKTVPQNLIINGCWEGKLPVSKRNETPHTGKGMQFQAVLNARPQGGDIRYIGDSILSIVNANQLTLILSINTSFVNYKNISGDPEARNKQVLENIADKNYQYLKQRHITDFSNLMNRVSLSLGDPSMNKLPTGERVKLANAGKIDPNLDALCFQFGRYVLISCSREGGLPANLQGIWDQSLTPPWESKYTLNINLEMNYWPAEVCNLSECHQPLFDFLKDLSVAGSETARLYYGAKGWVAHHNTDIWCGTAPVNGILAGLWPMGGAWISLDIWDHYAFTNDLDFLKEYYPVMKGAAQFILDVMVEHPNLGWLVIPFSSSPEHAYFDQQGNQVSLSPSPTIDIAITRELFSHCIKASELLDNDSIFSTKLKIAMTKMPPYQINSEGYLQEWLEDWKPGNQGHNCSPNFAVFPGTSISPQNTPRLASAVEKWNDDQVPAKKAWRVPWNIGVWARLHRKDKTTESIQAYISNGIAPNLNNKPYNQVDATLGFSAAVAETLLQSHENKIELLPALSDRWSNGSVKGLKARGDFEVDIKWEKGELVYARIYSEKGGACKVCYRGKSITLDFAPQQPICLDSLLKPTN